MRTVYLSGAQIDGIESFYAEINRVFMSDEDWNLSASLDALNDLLYGEYGATQFDEPVEVIMTDHAHAREALGIEVTAGWLRDKIAQPNMFDVQSLEKALDDLHLGKGKTYWDHVLDVFSDHPRITLTLR
ncbi:ribonuclease inhibitor [Plantibacter sp. Mn2098]|uniref:ribonuclease inhibitor n=1 Tax=Plantibacter sp. Mn2098 TaxID=3395266 RepID=UPI003BC3BBE2